MTNSDVVDPGVERYLRDTFAADASASPGATDLDSLAGSAVRHGRARRRRTAVAGAALSLVLVIVGVGVAQQLTPRTSGTPGDGASPTTSPDSSVDASVPIGPEVDGPALMFRGVEVPVPAAMLDPDAVRCGTPVADAAYAIEDSMPVEDCLMVQPPDLTIVLMQPLEEFSAIQRVPGSYLLDDGRTEVRIAIPEREVMLTVTSPDPQTPEALIAGAVIVEAPLGCPVRPTPLTGLEPLTQEPTINGALAFDGTAKDGRVCGYRANWLTGARLLDAEQVQQLSAALAALPSGATIDCAGYEGELTTGWWIELGSAKFWAGPTRGCSTVFGASGGSRFLTEDLKSRLWELAPGPAAS